MTPIVKGHYVGDSESWSVELKNSEGAVVASMQGLASCTDANKAAEWVQAGIAADWCLHRAPSAVEIEAGVEAVREERSLQKRRKREGAKFSKAVADKRMAVEVLCAARMAWVRSVKAPLS
jgi:hypothetical protein